MRVFIALLSGLLFGLGLGLGGMTQPAVVLGFLDIFGHWDPRLVFVMAGAITTTALGYRRVLCRARPVREPTFQTLTTSPFDARLLGGAAMFGIGWGVAGYCPGPALASLSGAAPSLLVLVACMVAGWWRASRVPANHSARSNRDQT